LIFDHHPLIVNSTGQGLFKFTFNIEKNTQKGFYLRMDVIQILVQLQSQNESTSHSTT